MGLTQGYNREISKQNRQTELFYLEVDQDDGSAITINDCGSGLVSNPWLYQITEPNNSFDSASSVNLFFISDILNLWNLGKLFNRTARLYRYRGQIENRNLLLSGRLWGPPSYNASGGLFGLDLIGFGATEITGELPAQRFNLNDYPGCPKSNLYKGVPVILGDVKDYSPVLSDIGGYGVLSADIGPLPTDGYTGSIPIADSRGTSFVLTKSMTSGLAATCTSNAGRIQVTSYVYGVALLDKGAGWLLIDDEIMRGVRKYQSGANYFIEVLRGGLFTIPAGHTSGADIREVGAVSIGNDVAVYRWRNSGSLGGVKGGFSGTPQAQSAGAQIRQYLPSYRYKVACHAVRTLNAENLYFLDSDTGKLQKNPFSDFTSINKSDAEITIINTSELVQVGISAHVFSGTTAYEVIPLDDVSVIDDLSSCYSNEDNLVDETMDPIVGGIPTSYAGYAVNAVPVYFYPDNYTLFQGDFISNPSNAMDEDTNTYASILLPEGYQSNYAVGIRLNFSNSQFESIAEYIVMDAEYQLYAHGGESNDSSAFYYYYKAMGESRFSNSIPITNQGDFHVYGYYHYPMPYGDFCETDGFWQNLKSFGGTIQLEVSLPDWNPETWQELPAEVFYREARVKVSLLSRGHLEAQNTLVNPTHISDTIKTEIAVYCAGNNFQIQYDNMWSGSAETWQLVGYDTWFLIPIPGSENWDSAADWKKAVSIRPASPEFIGKMYHCCLINHYSTNGAWSNIGAAYDGLDDTYALYTANAVEVILELKTMATPAKTADLNAVRLLINATQNLGTVCQVGIGTPGDSGSVTDWYNISDGTNAIDITESNDGPGAGNWTWAHLNAASGYGLSIFIKTNGTAGQTLKLYNIEWSIVTASEINPETAPLIISELTGYSDYLNGPYGSTVIRNFAWAEKYLLMEHIGINSGRIDIPAYGVLASRLSDMSISAVISEVEPAETVISRIRAIGSYNAISSNGIITPQDFPEWADTPVATLDDSNTLEEPLTITWGNTENLCNFPIAEYKKRYFDDSSSRAILPTLVQGDNRRKIDRNLMHPQMVYDQRSRNLDRLETTNLATAYPTAWAMAEESKIYHGGWFRRVFRLDYISTIESAQAFLARIIYRYAWLPPIINVSCSPRVADSFLIYGVVWLVRSDLPLISGYTVPAQRVSSSYTDNIYAIKCAVLEIAPDGDERVLTLEGIRYTQHTSQTEINNANPANSAAFDTPGAGWDQGTF